MTDQMTFAKFFIYKNCHNVARNNLEAFLNLTFLHLTEGNKKITFKITKEIRKCIDKNLLK